MIEQVQDLFGLVSTKITDMSNSDVVVGAPIEAAGCTIVPLSRVSVGFGGAGGEGEGEGIPSHGPKKSGSKKGSAKGKGDGGGAGGGGKVRPVAVVIFNQDGVTVEPLSDKKGILDKIVDKVPEVIDLVKKATAKDE